MKNDEFEGERLAEDDGIRSEADRNRIELQNMHIHHNSQHLIDEAIGFDPFFDKW